jgi:hypothetical protein
VGIAVVRTITVVVVIVPIAIRVPPAIVFTPPAVTVFPAPFAGDFQFRALRFGLGTVPAMLFSGSVKIMVNADHSPLAIFLIGTGVRRTKKKCGANQRSSYQQCFSQHREFHPICHQPLFLHSQKKQHQANKPARCQPYGLDRRETQGMLYRNEDILG